MVMEFVTDWIAIGDIHDARNIKALKEARIEAVLCVAEWVRMPRKKYHEAGIVYRALRIKDHEPLPEEKQKALFAALEFLDELVAQKKRCLIHCAAGISRSPAVLAAWMHTRLGMSWAEAVAHIQSVRLIVNPNPEPFASIRVLVDTAYPK